MALKSFTIRYECGHDGWWRASVKELDGCSTQGRSVAQARARILEAMTHFDVVEPFITEEVVIKRMGGPEQ